MGTTSTQKIDVGIVGAGYGAGHLSAARAIAQALAGQTPAPKAEVRDYLDWFPDFLRWVTMVTYVTSVRQIPALYGAIYSASAKLLPIPGWSALAFGVGLGRFEQWLEQRQPKVLVLTHPLPMGALSLRKRQGQPLPLVLGVVTDFSAHPAWVQSAVDRYYVASSQVRERLVAYGVPEGQIRVVGIPIREDFWRPFSARACRIRFGWDPRELVVLFMTSVLGNATGIEAAVHELLRIEQPFRLVVVTGRDYRLRRALSRLHAAGPVSLNVLGFTTEVAQLMAASDLVVTKAGGVTVAETLAAGRPLVIYRPAPGQEEENAHWLWTGRACLVANDGKQLGQTVQRLLRDARARDELAGSARRLAKPGAAQTVAEDIIRELQGKLVQPPR